MKTKILFSSILCGLFISPFATANDKVDRVYNPQKYEQVCKGKTQGAPVSFAYRGIIWNGTCEPQFIPNKAGMANMQGTESEIYTTCNSMGTTSANINGMQVNGKCALAFTPPRPR